MKTTARNGFKRIQQGAITLRGAIAFSCFFFHLLAFGQTLPKDVFVSIEAQRGSLYSILAKVSEQSGFLFVYDNKIIDNDKIINIRKTRSELFAFLRSLLPGKEIDFKIIGRHILIFESTKKAPDVYVSSENPIATDTAFFLISGFVIDRMSGKRLPYASVGIAREGFGISTNLDGYFRLRVPNALSNESITIQHLGYQSKQLPVELLKGNTIDVFLEPSVIDLPEVVIRNYDPMEVLRKVLDLVDRNIPQKPVYHYNFYREGVSRNYKLINYSEAIFKIFKDTPNQGLSDQVKVLRGRNTTNADNTDTLVLKLKAGVQSTLELDILKVPPDFLQPDFMKDFTFTNGGFSTRGENSAFAIEFVQKKEITSPLYKGTIYVDTEDYAIIEAEFEINPKFISNAGNMFFIGWKKEYVPTMKRASYKVGYQKYDGYYHIHHIRGELELEVKTKKGSSANNYSAFFETVVVKIDHNGAKRFAKRDIIKPNTVFLDSGYPQDQIFWGDYNVITPETSVIEAFNGIKSRIERFLEE